MFSVSPETYNVLSLASRWLFVFFALMILFFAFSWHRTDRKERKNRFKNLPGAGTVGEFVVLSGSEELSPDTWFPVPREGVLGALRTCDLVVPCDGVRSQHLDFSWQDGTGLLIRPRIGCEVLVDGVPVSRRGAWADTPLIHGSVLQVGSAVLKLQLYAALSHTNRVFSPQAAVPAQNPAPAPYGSQYPPSAQVPPAAMQPWPSNPYPPQSMSPVQPGLQPPVSPASYGPQQPMPEQQAPVQPDRSQPVPPRRRNPDRWKEDWSE